jgi:predicted HicB family RNase H-like nuclease
MSGPMTEATEEAIRIQVKVDPKMRRQIRMAAAKADLSVPAWVRRALEAMLGEE